MKKDKATHTDLYNTKQITNDRVTLTPWIIFHVEYNYNIACTIPYYKTACVNIIPPRILIKCQ